jgi:hypothetical protein
MLTRKTTKPVNQEDTSHDHLMLVNRLDNSNIKVDSELVDSLPTPELMLISLNKIEKLASKTKEMCPQETRKVTKDLLILTHTTPE